MLGRLTKQYGGDTYEDDILTFDAHDPRVQNAIPEPIEVRQVLFQNSDEYVETPVYLRDKFVPGQSIPGPCICEQMDTTLVVPKGWVIHVDGYHNLKIHDEEAK